MTIPVTMSKTLQTRFKLRAVRAFPREYIAFLAGRRADDHLEVIDMFFPAYQKENTDDSQITIPDEWWIRAFEYAAAKKLIVLGSVHTHTYGQGEQEYEAIPSKCDMSSWEIPDLICGIANVVCDDNGHKSCCDINFYGRPTTCPVTFK